MPKPPDIGIDRPLLIYFLIAFLLPIIATSITFLQIGFYDKPVITADIDPWSLFVIVSMIHAPALAALIVLGYEQGGSAIKQLFLQLFHWNYPARYFLIALLVFPVCIITALLLLSRQNPLYTPAFYFSTLLFASLFGTMWEEIGWTGYATTRMLNRLDPLKTAILLGTLHWLWHIGADLWGAYLFYGSPYNYVLHLLLWLAGLVILRIITVWLYLRSGSLVLAWLTHFSYTGGQLMLVPLTLSASQLLLWNACFVIAMCTVVSVLLATSTDFRQFARQRTPVLPLSGGV